MEINAYLTGIGKCIPITMITEKFFSLYDESKKVYILNILENRKNKIKIYM